MPHNVSANMSSLVEYNYYPEMLVTFCISPKNCSNIKINIIYPNNFLLLVSKNLFSHKAKTH